MSEPNSLPWNRNCLKRPASTQKRVAVSRIRRTGRLMRYAPELIRGQISELMAKRLYECDLLKFIQRTQSPHKKRDKYTQRSSGNDGPSTFLFVKRPFKTFICGSSGASSRMYFVRIAVLCVVLVLIRCDLEHVEVERDSLEGG